MPEGGDVCSCLKTQYNYGCKTEIIKNAIYKRIYFVGTSDNEVILIRVEI